MARAAGRADHAAVGAAGFAFVSAACPSFLLCLTKSTGREMGEMIPIDGFLDLP